MQVNTGLPKDKGMYVCYIDLPIQSKFMEKRLLFWFSPCWCYPGSDQIFRGEVHCWIGPLPSPTKEELEQKNNIAYAITTLKDADEGAFKDGPFDTLKEAQEVIGEQGDYIFKVDITNVRSIPIRKWGAKQEKWLKKKGQ